MGPTTYVCTQVEQVSGGLEWLQNWPEDIPYAPELPATLPSGRQWPRVSVLTVTHHAAEHSCLSVKHQSHPSIEHVVEAPQPGEDPGIAWRRALARATGMFVICLPDGDLLAPGALASACVVADTEDADAVCGLRIVVGSDKEIHYVDVIDYSAGSRPSMTLLNADTMVRRSIIDATGLSARPVRPVVIGRPMALQTSNDDYRGKASQKLSILALADGGAGGGARIAHRRLVDALRLAGHSVETAELTTRPSPSTAEWVDTFPDLESQVKQGNYDLIVAGNIHAATRRADVLARIHQHTPVAAVLHDMFLLSGRCDVPLGCPLIYTGCTEKCPTPNAYPYLAPGRIRSAWQSKRDFMRMQPPPLLLANSRWTEHFARTVLGHELAPIVHRINLAFPSQVFRPRERRKLRHILGLPENDVLVSFAAANSDNPMKGMGDVIHALRLIARPGIGFIVVGRIDNPKAIDLPNLFAPGPITDEARLSEWLAASDLHITASRFESLGQTPIEAGLCGVPTIAYRHTGLTTAVIEGVSGRLVEPSPEGFADSITRLINDAAARAALGAWGRLVLEARHSHAASYLSILPALRAHGLLPAAGTERRIRFEPTVIGAFDMATNPAPGGLETVSPRPRPTTRVLRRLKHSIWGRTMPLSVRVGLRFVKNGRVSARRIRS